ncbi:hypothetical protein [Massilia brevitalea]|uniref:hypothetical protein n=1 Tax=Massilia brevitalea TaxID=442526 RepID=UPI0027388896|nr:hypothetical protein [Massilia brevitalea]
MTTASLTVLDAQTTAHALVRVLMGTVPTGKTVEELNSAIRSADQFAPLVAVVAREIEQGRPPLTSKAATPLAMDVIAQAMALLVPASATAPAPGPSGTRLLAISSNRASDLQPPYVIVGTSRVGVQIVDGGVVVRNTLPLAWSANTSPDPEVVELPAASIQSALTLAGLNGAGHEGTLIDFLSGLETKTLTNNQGKAFDLSVFQDEASRRTNTKAMIVDTVKLALSMMAADPLVEDKCVQEFVNATYQPDEIEAIYRSGSMESLRNYLIALVKDAGVGLASTCLQIKIETPSVLTEKLVEVVTNIPGELFTNFIGLAGKYAALTRYSNTPKVTVGVCETPGRAFGFTLVNCATRFEMDPIAMAPGAESVLAIRAFDRNGKLTAASTGLSITAPANAGYVAIDEANRLVRSLKKGTVDIVVEDKGVDVRATVRVDVVDPVLNPTAARVEVGGTAVFFVRGPSGEPIVLPRSGMEPRSADSAVAEFNLPASFLLGSGGTAFTARGGGQTTVSVSHPSWATTPSAVLIVDAAPPPVPANGAFYTGQLETRTFEGQNPNTFALTPVRGFSFRLGGESLNVREELENGCVGGTAPIAPTVGSSFTLDFASNPPWAAVVPGKITFTITRVAGTRIDGTFLYESVGPTGIYRERGNWISSQRPSAFPKCLPPTRVNGVDSQGRQTTDTPSFFCSTYDPTGDPWGCSYRGPLSPARPGEWQP